MTDRFDEMRRAMVASQLRTTAIDDPRLIYAMSRVPRETFVPIERRAMAYVDLAIPLGNGRSLNSPMATGRLLDAAAIEPGDAVLIVGAATGYALSIAALLSARAVGVEVDSAMAAAARMAVPDAEIVEGPLEAGAPDRGPFDVIVIDGAVERIPEALIGQLALHGRLATGLIEGSVTRIVLGRRGGSAFGLASVADMEAVWLPGFATPREFVF